MPNDKLINIKTVCETLCRSRASIYRDIQREDFPAPKIWLVVPDGDEGSSTGSDRQIAEMLTFRLFSARCGQDRVKAVGTLSWPALPRPDRSHSAKGRRHHLAC
jgi:hypothetical protein